MYGRGPHGWSHDASVMACMYLSAMGWPLVTCDVVVTTTWQPPPATIDMYCHPLPHAPEPYLEQQCVDMLNNMTCMHASCVAMLVDGHVGSQICF